jgi:hypothetical protein
MAKTPLTGKGSEFLLLTEMKLDLMTRFPDRGSDWAEAEAKAELARAKKRQALDQQMPGNTDLIEESATRFKNPRD